MSAQVNPLVTIIGFRRPGIHSTSSWTGWPTRSIAPIRRNRHQGRDHTCLAAAL